MRSKQRYETSRWQHFVQTLRGMCAAIFTPGNIADYRAKIAVESAKRARSDLCLAFVTVVAAVAIVRDKPGVTFSSGPYPIAPEHYEVRITIMKKGGGMCHLYIGEKTVLCVDGKEGERILDTTDSPSNLASIIQVQLDL